MAGGEKPFNDFFMNREHAGVMEPDALKRSLANQSEFRIFIPIEIEEVADLVEEF